MLSTFVQVVQKWLGTNDILRNKSHSDIKFAKLSLGLLCTLGTVVVHLYFGFSLRDRWRHNEPPTSEPHICNTFVSIWGTIASPILFRLQHSSRCPRTGCATQRNKRFAVPLVKGATKFANLQRKFSKTKTVGRSIHAKYFLWLLLK